MESLKKPTAEGNQQAGFVKSDTTEHNTEPKIRKGTKENEPDNTDSSQNNVIELSNGECFLVGPEYSLIPEGSYQAKFLYHETSNIFTRKEGKVRTGGKLYLWFEILPFYSDEINGVRLFKSYNVASLIGKKGRNGKFRMTRGKWFVRDYERLIGRTKRRDRLSPRAFSNKIFLIKTKTVVNNQDHKEWCEESQYSVIEKIMEVIAGV